jgi:Na+-transporting NADH:ubiquinone oxidoreductase subunit NqrD
MTSLEIFNLIEACIWICIGTFLLLIGPKYFNVKIKLILPGSVLFFLFGISDIVEIFSGSWYRPWWLFAWKVANAVLLLGFMIYLIKFRKTSRI